MDGIYPSLCEGRLACQANFNQSCFQLYGLECGGKETSGCAKSNLQYAVKKKNKDKLIRRNTMHTLYCILILIGETAVLRY